MKNIIAFLTVLFIIQSNLKSQTDSNSAELYSTTSFTAAIFFDSYPLKGYTVRFKPTKREVDKTEKALSRDLMQLNKDRKYQTRDFIIHKRLMRYNRQYFGIVAENGDRIIFVNAYFAEQNKDPHADIFLKELVQVQGEGPKYWSIKYNLDQDVLFNFDISQLAEKSDAQKESERTLTKKELKAKAKAEKKAAKAAKKEKD